MNRPVLAFLVLPLLINAQACISVAPAFGRSTPQANGEDPAAQKIVDANAAVAAARAATRDKRYADAEALMLKLTNSRPELVLPWLELGLAQLGLKQYSDAEKSFKVVTNSASDRTAGSVGFFQDKAGPDVVAPTATRNSRDLGTHTVDTGKQRTPEVLAVAYASLGEIYIHEGKTAEAQAAYDSAAQAYPSQAAIYRENEAIFFFQAGNADAQLAAAEKAIAADPTRAKPYFFKAQALVSKATVDPQTQKMVLPTGCADAYHKYLQIEPNGQFAADAKGVLAAAAPAAK